MINAEVFTEEFVYFKFESTKTPDSAYWPPINLVQTKEGALH